MSVYTVKEIFGPTVQGEGLLIGEVCFFLRFAGCNQWSGYEKDRADSQCPFCDTDFINGTKMDLNYIVGYLESKRNQAEWLVVSGGEPMLQYDRELNDKLRELGWNICIETNGTIPIKFLVDHISLSPKTSRDKVVLQRCDSLKLLYPNPNTPIEEWEDFLCVQRFLQPIWYGPNQDTGFHPDALKRLYQAKGKWRLSPQLHKLIGVE